jgi:hypothetical protein
MNGLKRARPRIRLNPEKFSENIPRIRLNPEKFSETTVRADFKSVRR